MIETYKNKKIPPLKDGILPLSQFFFFSDFLCKYLITSHFLKVYCCLYCEAETFQAIHNVLLPPVVLNSLLFILRSRNFSSNSQPGGDYQVEKVLLFILRSRNFSSNSQPSSISLQLFINCCLYCEAETFQAIHNRLLSPVVVLLLLFILRSRNFSSNSQQEEEVGFHDKTVVYTAKQKLFKQFTTRANRGWMHKALLFILRSRNFSSNSQRTPMTQLMRPNCCLYCEAETFQAIHNKKLLKIIIIKLLFILRSRNFSSNSQPSSLCRCKLSTVVYTAKQKLFKQFTTALIDVPEEERLLFILRSRNFSSNS